MTTSTHEKVQVELDEKAVAALQALGLIPADEPAEEPETDKYAVLGEFIEIPIAKTKPLMKAWHDAKAAYDEAKAELEAAKQAILDAMEQHEVLVAEETGQLLVESRVSTAMVLDTAKFKKAHPDLAVKFQRERRSRSFRVLV